MWFLDQIENTLKKLSLNFNILKIVEGYEKRNAGRTNIWSWGFLTYLTIVEKILGKELSHFLNLIKI